MQGLTILSTSLLKLNSALEFLRKNVAERKLQLKQKYCKELSNFVQSSYKKVRFRSHLIVQRFGIGSVATSEQCNLL